MDIEMLPGKLVMDDLTDLELASLNNAAQAGWSLTEMPIYDKVKDICEGGKLRHYFLPLLTSEVNRRIVPQVETPDPSVLDDIKRRLMDGLGPDQVRAARRFTGEDRMPLLRIDPIDPATINFERFYKQ